MNCSSCKNKARHSILVRLGEVPNSLDPKIKDKDKSGVHVVRFCETHWNDAKKCIPQIG